MVMIVYTVIGLPLTMVFLANIGGKMADFITYVYSRFKRKNKNWPLGD